MDGSEIKINLFCRIRCRNRCQVIQLIGESLNQKVYLIPIPKGFITFIARLGDLLHLPLNSERLTKLTENYLVSNQKLKNA